MKSSSHRERIGRKENKDLNILKKTFTFLKPYKIKFGIAVICMIGSIFLGTLQPLLFGRVIDLISLGEQKSIVKLLLIIAFVFFIHIIFNIMYRYFMAMIASKIEIDARKKIFSSILVLPMGSYDKTKKGEFLTKLDEDVQAFSDVLTQKIMIFIDVGTALIIGVILFKINWILTVILLGIFPISIGLFTIYGKKIRTKEVAVKAGRDEYFGFIQETLNGFKTIKILCASKIINRKYSEILIKLYKIGLNKIFIFTFANSLSQLVNFLGYVIFLGVGAHQIFAGNLTIGGLVAFNSYSGTFRNSLLKISQINVEIQQALVSLNRIFDLIDQCKNKDNLNRKSRIVSDQTFTNDIHIKDLSFRYKEDKPLILKDINLSIPANKMTAIVGLSGIGKTTLLNLLVGLYRNYEGQILLGDTNYADITKDQIFENVTLVPQETFLISGSIKENLLLAKSDSTDQEIEKACKVSNIHNYIISLKDQYDSKIGPDGIQLSVGQKQRLAVARSLLRNPKIYLFDEITSSLDTESELHIKKMLKNLSKDHTVIAISHRLTTISEADHVILLKENNIVKQGSVNDLLKYSHFYEEIVDMS